MTFLKFPAGEPARGCVKTGFITGFTNNYEFRTWAPQRTLSKTVNFSKLIINVVYFLQNRHFSENRLLNQDQTDTFATGLKQ